MILEKTNIKQTDHLREVPPKALTENMIENKDFVTFNAHIVGVPNQDSKGNYHTTLHRDMVNKRTGEETSATYRVGWYQFSVTLTSILSDGQECNIPLDFEINLCILSKPYGEYKNGYTGYIKKLKHILSCIRLNSDIKFSGVPQRLDESRELQRVKPTDIENAHEIYINENYIDTIRIEQPTKETLEKQRQYTQRKKQAEKPRFWRRAQRVVRQVLDKISAYVKQNILHLIGIIISIITLVVVIRQGGC